MTTGIGLIKSAIGVGIFCLLMSRYDRYYMQRRWPEEKRKFMQEADELDTRGALGKAAGWFWRQTARSSEGRMEGSADADVVIGVLCIAYGIICLIRMAVCR